MITPEIWNQMVEHRDKLQAEVERMKLERGIALYTAKQLQAQVLALKSWQESVLAEVGSEPVRFAINCDHEYEGEWCLACEANHYEAKCLHLAAKLVEAQSWKESVLKEVGPEPVREAFDKGPYGAQRFKDAHRLWSKQSALRLAAKLVDASMAQQRIKATATQNAIELEQCSLFVDSEPLKRAMTDAAAFLRRMAMPAQPLNAAQIEDAIMGTRVEAPQPLGDSNET